MATNFSPCKGSYVLNQFPSNVMFGINGFHVSASGAIQGHRGPLVSSPEHKVVRVSYCDHSPSVGVRPSVVRSHFLVYTLASTNINQLAQNLVQVCMTIRSRMSSIMELIGPELSKLSALELENLPFLTLFTL